MVTMGVRVSNTTRVRARVKEAVRVRARVKGAVRVRARVKGAVRVVIRWAADRVKVSVRVGPGMRQGSQRSHLARPLT